MIALEQVSRAPGGLPVLSEVSFHISDTDRLGVVGPNGSGKTTLLRLLAGYDEADAGIIRRSRGQRLGYLPQEVAEIGERPVLEIVLDGAPEVRELERRIDRIESVARGERAGEEGDDPAELGALYDQLAALGGRGVEARAKRILSGLGFSDEEMTRSAATFSGGWLMRIVLGKLLLAHPDVLLLDEPTNHLDLPSLEWLETFLQEHHGALVVVSHDRVFLDRLVTDVLEVDSASVVRWAGNCTSWIAARELRAAQEEHAAAHERRRRAEVERFVERFRYKNTKAKQVQSRIKALERSDASGGVSSPERKRSSLRGFDFPQPERTARLVASLESAVVGYGAEPVLRGVDFAVQRGERVALLGANGTGKSTLLKVLAGSIPLEEGTRKLGGRVHTATLAQHQVHELDLDATVLTLATAVDPAAPIRRVRAALGALAFREEDMEKPVGVLSGGEKARLALARMLLKPAPLLLLDEPTSHLDVTARAALEHALLTFEGTIVFVSHDRHFINALASAVVELRDGDALRYEGNYDNWRSQKKAAEATQEAQPESFEQVDEAATEPQKLSRKDERRAAAELRKRRTEQLGPLEREVKEIEDAIAETEQALADLDLLISDPDFYAKQVDGGVFRERSELRERADELTERWVETKERLEQAEREFEEAERELS